MLELAESDANGLKKVPCFYIGWRDENGNERIAFGHTAYFRLPYELSVHDHIPACHKDEDTIDFARAIFGSTRMSAGKVFLKMLNLLDMFINMKNYTLQYCLTLNQLLFNII